MAPGRITRAKAAEVAEKLHIDEDAVLDLSSDARDVADGMVTPETPLHRTPLGELAPNSGSSRDDSDDVQLVSRPVEKHGKKSSKGKKANNALHASAFTLDPPLAESQAIPDGIESVVPSSASEVVAESSVMEEVAKVDMSHLPNQDNKAASHQENLTTVPENVENETSVSGISEMPTMQRSNSPVALSTPQTAFIDTTASKVDISAMESEYDELEAAVIDAGTPSRSTKSVSPQQQPAKDAIIALDEIEHAAEKINTELPKAKKEKAVPAVRPNKASQARMSIALGGIKPPPALGRPRQSLAMSGRSEGQRVTSTSSVNSTGRDPPEEKKEVVIPHSKPRPISMSFPAPRPPPKSTKPPTQANFQLPGEAMSAKFKAAREARALKEAEAKKKVFKARPAPSMNKVPVVRQTSTSKARESLIGGKPLPPSGGHNRANSVATSRPATKVAPSAKKSTVPSKAVTVPKRASTAMGGLDKRVSLAAKPNPPATHNRIPSTGHTLKGKEVFNRTALAKTTAEKEKREKEESAKQARAAAAERSRQLSREWAEKQRMKKTGAKTAPSAAVSAGVAA